jgi:hypothetical protein
MLPEHYHLEYLEFIFFQVRKRPVTSEEYMELSTKNSHLLENSQAPLQMTVSKEIIKVVLITFGLT